MPEDHPLSLGVFGYAGSRWATEALLADDVDVLLVLGSGLTQRDTMYWEEKMRPRQAIVHVDSDATRVGRTWPAVPVMGDPGATLRVLLGASHDHAAALDASADERRAWLERVRAIGSRHYDEENCTSDATPIHPARAISELRAAAPRDTGPSRQPHLLPLTRCTSCARSHPTSKMASSRRSASREWWSSPRSSGSTTSSAAWSPPSTCSSNPPSPHPTGPEEQLWHHLSCCVSGNGDARTALGILTCAASVSSFRMARVVSGPRPAKSQDGRVSTPCGRRRRRTPRHRYRPN